MWIRIRNLFDPGSGIEKFEPGIRDKHPGSATLGTVKPKINLILKRYIVSSCLLKVVIFFPRKKKLIILHLIHTINVTFVILFSKHFCLFFVFLQETGPDPDSNLESDVE
jgi:hypothetical protein